MAASTSLHSVVALFPPLSCPGGLKGNSRLVFVAPSSSESLWSHNVCRHDGMRILWGGFLSGGVLQCGARSGNGVVRALEESKSPQKSRRRVKKPVKELEVSEGLTPVQSLLTEGAESDFDQVLLSNLQSKPLKKKRFPRAKMKNEIEVNGLTSSSGRQETDIELLQQRVDDDRDLSTNGEEESSSHSVQDAREKSRTRAGRTARAATQRSDARMPEGSSNTKPLAADQAGETGTNRIDQREETGQGDVESLVNFKIGAKKSTSSSKSRTRRKKKTSVTGEIAPANGSVVTALDIEDLRVNSEDKLKRLKTQDDLLSSSGSEDIHDDRVESLDEQSKGTSTIVVDESRVERGKSNKSPRQRKKRGKVAKDQKVSGDEELENRVRQTAVPSLQKEVEAISMQEGSSETKGATVVEGEGAEARLDNYHDIAHVEVKKKRPRRTRKTAAAVVGSSEDSSELKDVRQSELQAGIDSGIGGSSAEDEGASSPVKVIDSDEVLESLPPSQPKVAAVPTENAHISDVPQPKKRSRRKRQPDREKQVIVQSGTRSEGEGSDTPLERRMTISNAAAVDGSDSTSAVDIPKARTRRKRTQVDPDEVIGLSVKSEEIKATPRVQFPAPTWGPQWWEEIQTRSQATISFQDIAERKEGSKTHATGLQDLVLESSEKAESGEPSERKWDRIEVNRDPDAVFREDAEIHQREALERSEKGNAKLRPTQKPAQESNDDWLMKMQMLVEPTEEPWLLESLTFAETDQESSTVVHLPQKPEVLEIPSALEEIRKEVSTKIDFSHTEIETGKKEPDVEVEILINTSECTMQRMAILEDKRLVEFSIEPVNTKVQVGNIYLGRVKQLLPGMSGVFIDIGGPRLALLDIARNQYPYTFPPVFVPENQSNKSSAAGARLQDEDLGLIDDDTDFDDEDENEEEEEEDEEGDEENGSAGNVEESEEVKAGKGHLKRYPKAWTPHKQGSPITVNFGRKFSKWRNVEEGMPIIVQVKKESMGKKGPRLTAFPSLAGRFWVLIPRGNSVGVSARITGPERRRLKLLAQALKPEDLGITVRTEAVGHDHEDLEKDLLRLMDTWKEITEKAAAAALAVDKGEEAAVPVLLHREMGQTLTIIRDFFTDKVSRLVVDSPQSYQEVISYLQDVAPHLMSRVVLYSGKVPIFDVFNVEADLEKISSERVKLPRGGYLVMQETEALVSIDVNGGTGMLGHSTRQRQAILEVNLAAAVQIASEIRLRDIGGIIVVDFIDMDYPEDEKLVHEVMLKAIQRDRSKVNISEISEFGLMEMIRKRVRPSVTLTIKSQCPGCKGSGRVEALETTLSKIERAIRRLLAEHTEAGEVRSDATKWPQILLRVEYSMFEFLKSWKKKRIVQLGNVLKVWISLKVGMELSRGQFEVTEVTKLEKQGAGVTPETHENLQQEKAVTAPVLGKRVWPKRRRFFPK